MMLKTSYSYLGLWFATNSALIHWVFLSDTYMSGTILSPEDKVWAADKNPWPQRTYILVHVDRKTIK